MGMRPVGRKDRLIDRSEHVYLTKCPSRSRNFCGRCKWLSFNDALFLLVFVVLQNRRTINYFYFSIHVLNTEFGVCLQINCLVT